jgi:hypothetical protein
MSGRCTGYPRGKCHKYNEYAKAKMRDWLCKSCKERKLKEWQGRFE